MLDNLNREYYNREYVTKGIYGSLFRQHFPDPAAELLKRLLINSQDEGGCGERGC